MIKIQLLLRHPVTGPDLHPDLCAALEQLGIHVTIHGRASASAEISQGNYEKLFHVHPAPAVRAEDTPELPIPASLKGFVTLITVAPQHVQTAPSGKIPNAAI
ncbi:MAG: hypothetical protein V4723_08100 [Pseudomonadota bacterium]